MKKITTKYNAILFCALVIFQSIKSILEYKEEPATLLDAIFNHDALMGSATLILLFLFSSAMSVWIIQSFWERFISPLFQIRALTLNEAISILLILTILSIWRCKEYVFLKATNFDLHDRDLGFVRFGWRDYDVNTAPYPPTDTGTFPTPLFSSIRSLFRTRPADRISAGLVLFFGK